MTKDDALKFFAEGKIDQALEASQPYPDLNEKIRSSLKLVQDKELYTNHYKQDNDRIPGQQITEKWGPDARQKEAMLQIAELKGSCLLDIGCADGSFCFFNMNNFNVFRVIGVDLWEHGIAWAKKYGSETFTSDTAKFIQGAFEDVTIPVPYDYDVVHVGEVLEHVQDPLKILKKAVEGATNLKGIVVTVPVDRPPLNDSEKVKMLKASETEHVRYIDIDTLGKYGAEVGLSVKKYKSIGQGWVSLVATLCKS